MYPSTHGLVHPSPFSPSSNPSFLSEPKSLNLVLHHRSISRQFPSEPRTQDLILSTMTPPAEGMSRGLSATTTSEIMVAAVVILLILSVVFFFFYLYHKGYHGAMPSIRSSRLNSIFAVPRHGTVPRRALDPAMIKVLPVVVFRSDDFNEGIECAVCLGELTEGEDTRMLPKCNHRFHLDCIDMWFHSNNTCPLCRSPVCSDPSPSRTQVPEAPAVEGNTTAACDFPSNVLVWGSGDRISTGVLAAAPASTHPESSSSVGSSSGKAEGVLVIEIPKRVGDGFSSVSSPLPSSGLTEEVISSPMSARLRSLRTLLSRGGRVVDTSRSPRVGDIEQGTTGVAPIEGSVQAPKTPTNS